jgi:hypothetical protein
MVFTNSMGQTFTTQFSDKIQSQSGISKEGVFLKCLQGVNGNILALYVKEKTRGITFGSRTYTIIKIDKNLNVSKETELDKMKVENGALIDFIKLKNKYYFITQQYNLRAPADNGIVAQELDPETLELKASRNIARFDWSFDQIDVNFLMGASAGFDIDLIYARDSLMFGLVYYPTVKERQNKTVQYAVFDESLNKKVAGSYDFKIPERKIEVNGFQVDIDGNAYIAYDQYDKNDEKSFKREDGEKVPSYKSHLLVIDKSGIKDRTIEHGGKFIKNIILGYDEKDNILLYGLYKNEFKGTYAGFCAVDLQKFNNKEPITFTFNNFPQYLISQVNVDDQGNDNGIGSAYSFREGITVSDGVKHLVLELISGSSDIRVFGNIIVITIKQNNSISYARIPKFQRIVNPPNKNVLKFSPVKYFVYSYECIFHNNNLLFFYNDSQDNIAAELSKKPDMMSKPRSSSLSCATVSHDGKLVKREVIYSHKDMDDYLTNTSFFLVEPNVYALSLLKTGILKYAVKFGKLSVN